MYKRGDQFQQNHSSPVFSTDDIEIGSRENMTDLCVTCTKVVRPRQEAIQCDSCHGWQHKTCGTNISRDFYKRLVKKEVNLENWHCSICLIPRAVSILIIYFN